jgi:hypothetical protein
MPGADPVNQSSMKFWLNKPASLILRFIFSFHVRHPNNVTEPYSKWSPNVRQTVAGVGFWEGRTEGDGHSSHRDLFQSSIPFNDASDDPTSSKENSTLPTTGAFETRLHFAWPDYVRWSRLCNVSDSPRFFVGIIRLASELRSRDVESQLNCWLGN